MKDTGRKQIFLSPVEIDLLQCSLQVWLDLMAVANVESKSYLAAAKFTKNRTFEMQERLRLLTVK